MTMTDRPTPCLPVHPQAAAWLRWPLAAGVLVLVSLLTPALANREEAASPTRAVASRLTSTATARARLPTGAPWVSIKARPGQSGFGKPFQRKFDRSRAPNPTGPPTPNAPLLGVTSPVATPTPGGAAKRVSASLFLPLVVRAASQRIPWPTQPPVASATPVFAQFRTPPVVSAATASPTTGAADATSHRLFLAMVLRLNDTGNGGVAPGRGDPGPQRDDRGRQCQR